MQTNNFNEEIKEKLKSYVSDVFYKKVSEIKTSEQYLDKSNEPNEPNEPNNFTKLVIPKTTSNDENFCVFNKAPESGLWYNWDTCIGNKYCAISYSAGATWIFNKSLPITPPIIYIFEIKNIKCELKDLKPKFELELSILEANGVRSLLLVEDDLNNPYCLIGTFEYPNESKLYNTKLLKWNFLSNTTNPQLKLSTLVTIKKDNSIRKIIRYQNFQQDIIFFSTQNDTKGDIDLTTKLYWIKKSDADNKNNSNPNYVKFLYKCEYVIGSIWDFYIDQNTVYVSVPETVTAENKLSGHKTLARLFYFNIDDLFYCFGFKIKNKIKVFNLIGNLKYPAGFNIDSISTVQVITNQKSKYVYIYSLSDFLYQIASLTNNPDTIQKIQTRLNIQLDQNNLLDLILELRKILLDFDIEGTRILKFNKSDLYSDNILISTVVGNPPYGTLNLSNTTNGFNSYTNLYTWSATSCGDNFYFGTLDLRSQIYNTIAILLSAITSNPELYQFLLTLPQDQIIIITELFNPNFCIGNLTDLSNKQLYFDVIKIKSALVDKITSSGFNTSDGLNQMADDGVRNLNIINHCGEKYLLIGTTCYQVDNVAKNYIVKIKQTNKTNK
jgi:hypothetical protein